MHFNLFEKVSPFKSWVADGCYSHQTDITVLVCLLVLASINFLLHSQPRVQHISILGIKYTSFVI